MRSLATLLRRGGAALAFAAIVLLAGCDDADGAITYEWYLSENLEDGFELVRTHTTTSTTDAYTGYGTDDFDLRVDVTTGDEFDLDVISVTVGSSGGGGGGGDDGGGGGDTCSPGELCTANQ